MEVREIANKQEWNKFVVENGGHCFFQSYEWGEVERKNGHKVNRFGLYENKKLVGAAQCIRIYAKRGNYLHIRHGPIQIDWNKRTLKILIDFLRNYSKNQNLNFIRVSPLIKDNQLLRELGFRDAPIHNMDAEISYVIDLSNPLDKVLANMRKNTRNLIRKAGKLKHLEVKCGYSGKLISDFLDIFKSTAQERKFVFERGIKSEIEEFSKKNQLEIIVAYSKKRAVAGALISYFGNQGIYRYAASTKKGRRLGAAYMVQWQAINNAKKRATDYYNLWGGVADLKDKSHPWYGITLFKKGFGGEKREYIHALDLPLSRKYWITYVLETAIKYIRGYDTLLGFRAPTFLRKVFSV
jgi:lipid II:glycine glycyltransferase (peptidoglycan interpeptide bridge formation enzyme)